MENKIEVFYKNKKVGIIAKNNNKYVFQYDDSWIENGFSISPLSLPLKKQLFIPTDMAIDGFFGVFADSLPDSWGKMLLERYLHKKGIDGYDGLYRLASIGKNGMGALEYKPDFGSEIDSIPELDELQKEADLILANEEANVDLLYRYGGSSGGARPKALIKLDNEYWIVKFQSRYDINDSGIVEFEYAQVCKEIGIKMPEVKLLESEISSGFFAVKRFDRIKEEKMHMISAAALLEADFRSPCADYLDLFKLTKIITRENKEDMKELFLRMCFNVYAHNLDDHIKNFSYLYDEKTKTYRLSPAYDMTYSNTYYNEHTTSVNHKGSSITSQDLITIGVKSGLSKEFCIDKDKLVREVVANRLGKYLK